MWKILANFKLRHMKTHPWETMRHINLHLRSQFGLWPELGLIYAIDDVARLYDPTWIDVPREDED